MCQDLSELRGEKMQTVKWTWANSVLTYLTHNTIVSTQSTKRIETAAWLRIFPCQWIFFLHFFSNGFIECFIMNAFVLLVFLNFLSLTRMHIFSYLLTWYDFCRLFKVQEIHKEGIEQMNTRFLKNSIPMNVFRWNNLEGTGIFGFGFYLSNLEVYKLRSN